MRPRIGIHNKQYGLKHNDRARAGASAEPTNSRFQVAIVKKERSRYLTVASPSIFFYFNY